MIVDIIVLGRRQLPSYIEHRESSDLPLIGRALSFRALGEKIPMDVSDRALFPHCAWVFADHEGGAEAMTLEQAQEVVEAIQPVIEYPEPRNLVLTCDAGISRSVAVGRAIASALSVPLMLPAKADGGDLANRHVRRLMDEALFDIRWDRLMGDELKEDS